jgi:hypothetical protein
VSEGRCKTCRWWEAKPTLFDDGPVVGMTISALAARPKVELLQRACECPKVVDGSELSDRQKNALPPDAAVYYDFESFQATFTTGPEFGCIHWEAKPPC